ncbi:MAG: glycoside hydrolase family 65 protein, partial [Gammaproteobacteria bacterium]
MSDWLLEFDRYRSEEEGLREALCALGNGYLLTRGAGEEATADGLHYPGTYLAGGYNRLRTQLAGRWVENEDLVNFPNWLSLQIGPPGSRSLSLDAVTVLSFHQRLDLRRGVLTRVVRFDDGEGRVSRWESSRLVSMADPHLAALRVQFTAENWSGPIVVRSALDDRICNKGVARYSGLSARHLERVSHGLVDPEGHYVLVRTTQSRLEVALAARTRAHRAGMSLLERAGRASIDAGDAGSDAGPVGEQWPLTVEQGVPLTVEKVVCTYSSRDRGISECALEACDGVARAGDYAQAELEHERAWARLWAHADIRMKQAPARVQLTLRLHAFHLLQTISPHTAELDVGVPARGLHGEAYRGHVFWDELFVLPFFNYRIPALGRALLMYRCRRLPQARRNAAAAGLKGALFPWQSGSNGREETQALHLNPRSGRWLADSSHLQCHVNAAVAYNVWQYFETTFDMDFLSRHGAAVIFEVARLFASMASPMASTGRYGIGGVMGPDEYHDAYPGAEQPGIDNNAYTNVMAAWVLIQAGRALERLPPDRAGRLREELGLAQGEVEHWDDLSRHLYVPFQAGGIVDQFEGYEALEELDWDAYRARYGDIRRLDRILEAEDDTPNRYKASKQADVLMLLYLFSAEALAGLFKHLDYEFDPASIPDIIDYYQRRTASGSSLSNAVQSWITARRDRPGGWRLFRETLQTDLNDVHDGTTR